MKILENLKKSLPKYVTIQPSTKKKVTFRPFTVKEEKNLIIANETGSFDDFVITLLETIEDCFKIDNSKSLPIFDIEHFFIKIRSKSIGEIVNPNFVCPETGEKISVTLNLDEIEPIFNENHTNEIFVSDSIKVTMKYPSMKYFMENQGDYYDMLVNCIDKIETKDELIESTETSKETITEFVDLLTKPQFKKLIEFFKTMPKIEKEIEYQTSDGIKRKIIFKGLRDFFQ